MAEWNDQRRIKTTGKSLFWRTSKILERKALVEILKKVKKIKKMSKVYTARDEKCIKREHTFQISGGNDESSKNKSRRN